MRKKLRCGRIVLLPTLALAILGFISPSIMGHPGAGIAVDRQGQIYFLDTGSGLWRIDTLGNLTHLSRTLFHWLAIDEDNRFANTQFPSDARGEILKVGNSPTILLSSDYPIAIAGDGNLYYPSGAAGNLRLMKMIPSGASSQVAAFPSTIKGTPLPYIGGITAGSHSLMFYTEDSAIRRITARGEFSTAASVPAAVKRVSIPATNSHPYLRGLAVDSDGMMYVADSGDARVLKITPNGKIITLVRTQSPWSPTAVALSGRDVYVLEFLHTASDVRREWLPRVRKITPDGKSKIIVTVDQMPGAR